MASLNGKKLLTRLNEMENGETDIWSEEASEKHFRPKNDDVYGRRGDQYFCLSSVE
jgi:hypothetical protein